MKNNEKYEEEKTNTCLEHKTITKRLSATCVVVGTPESVKNITLEDVKNIEVPHHILYADK